MKKNKRNTRRGRAKRWRYVGRGRWDLARTPFRVWAWAFGGFDVVDVRESPPFVFGGMPRAAAMRAAEHLARRR